MSILLQEKFMLQRLALTVRTNLLTTMSRRFCSNKGNVEEVAAKKIQRLRKIVDEKTITITEGKPNQGLFGNFYGNGGFQESGYPGFIEYDTVKQTFKPGLSGASPLLKNTIHTKHSLYYNPGPNTVDEYIVEKYYIP